MKQFHTVSGLALLLMFFALVSCDRKQPAEAATAPVEAPSWPVAVPNPPEGERLVNRFEPRALELGDVELNIMLPAGVELKAQGEDGVWVLEDSGKLFSLRVETDSKPLEQLVESWRTSTEGYQFLGAPIETPAGTLMELGHNGFKEFHVEYVLENGKQFIRLSNTKDKPFSEFHAGQMFHACRTAKVKS